MRKPTKYRYLTVVQQYTYYGWEDLTQSEKRSEAKADLSAYRKNAPGPEYRLITRRERREP